MSRKRLQKHGLRPEQREIYMHTGSINETEQGKAAINPAVMAAATEEQLASPLWRISNLYTIQSASATGELAGPIPFVPTPEQQEVLHHIYVLGHEFLLIIKSRQLGLSTLLCIIILDSCLFGAGIQCSIVDKTQDDAVKKLDGKISYAWEALDSEFRTGWEKMKDNDGEFKIKISGADKSHESTIYAATSARGGTNHILFISEWGEVQWKDKNRSVEILTGALPTADHPGCLTVIETTWKGGKTGELWPIVETARKTPERLKGPKDTRLLFFGWWTGKHNRDHGDPAQITAKTHEYCDAAEHLIKRQLDNSQRLWWQKMKDKLKGSMSSEHPTTLDECLEALAVSAWFDAAGLQYQHEQAVSIESRINFGTITLQGQPPERTPGGWVSYGQAAFWKTTPEAQAVYRTIEEPREGESYLLYVDFCVGKQAVGSKDGDKSTRDTHSYGVIRAGRLDPFTKAYRKPQIVASCMADDRDPTPETIRRIVALHRWYGDCMTVPEINSMGDIAERLEAAGCTNIWTQQEGADGARQGTAKTTRVLGWLTTEGTRKQMLDNYQEIILQQSVIVSFLSHHHQMSVFLQNAKGRPEAASNEHDDHVTGPAIGFFCLPAATLYQPSRILTPQGGMRFGLEAQEFDPRG